MFSEFNGGWDPETYRFKGSTQELRCHNLRTYDFVVFGGARVTNLRFRFSGLRKFVSGLVSVGIGGGMRMRSKPNSVIYKNASRTATPRHEYANLQAIPGL